MKTFENIDEILKKGMENYQPTPPADVWSHLEQNLVQAPVGSTQSHLGNAGKIVNAVKSAGIITKIAILAVVPSLFGVYLILQPDPVTNKPEVSSVDQVLEPAKTSEPNQIAPVLDEPEKKVNLAVKKSAHSDGQEVNSAKIKPNNNPTTPLIENKSNTQNTVSNVGSQNANNTGNGITVNPANPVKTETQTKVQEDMIPIQVPKIEDIQKKDAPTLEFKNVFTPNGDGLNDKFEIVIENPVYYHLIIYDYKGKVVFESTDKNINWNGTDMKTGMDCDAGYYNYSFDYQLSNSKQVQNKKEWLLLNR